ncbi:MAG: Gfo/Idh/MocA family oxidoreductase [Chloroflexi bacterium]|nr:Gfo/Idh/MocA family oxidoreductase [Chloroflexota bacterium]
MSEARPPTLRIGIAGLGVGAMNMIPELHAHPKATIAAAADLRPQALDRFRADFGGPTFTSVEEMCAKAGIDVVYVMTPDPLHAEHAIVAAEHGKHVMLDKPMGLTLEECDRVIEAAGRNNVHVLVGHTQSLDPPILKMAQIADSGRLGKPVMLHTMLYSDWVYRPRTPEELMQDRGGSIVRRQGPIQVDILRMIGGGMVKSVRATANAADPARPIDGSYTAFLAFEDGHAATMVYDGYAHFDSSELTHGFTMGGMPFDPGMHTATRARSDAFADAAAEEAYKESTRYGGAQLRPVEHRPGPDRRHAFFGLTLVSCEHGAMRQTPAGVALYGDAGTEEVEVPDYARRYTAVEVDEMHRAITTGAPLRVHGARWGKATQEVVLAIIASSEQQREVYLEHQVPYTGTEVE